MQHDGKGPATTAERKEFTQAVTKQKRNSDEENFDEAVTLFRRAGTKTGVSLACGRGRRRRLLLTLLLQIPSEIQALFNDPSCENLSASVSVCNRDSPSLDSSPPNVPVLKFLAPPPRGAQLHPTPYYIDSPPSLWRSPRYEGRHTTLRRPANHLPREGEGGPCARRTTPRRAAREPGVAGRQGHQGRGRDVCQAFSILEGCEGEEPEDGGGGFVAQGSSRYASLYPPSRSFGGSSLLKQLSDSIRAAAGFSEIVDDSLSVYFGLQASERFFVKEGRYPGTAETDIKGDADLAALEDIAGEILKGVEGGEVTEELSNVLGEMCVPLSLSPCS
jgi:hypothetical protein